MDDSAVQFGTGGSDPWWRRLTRRSVLIPVFALLFVAIGIWVFISLKSSTQKKTDAVDAAIKASDMAFEDGNYQESIKQLQAAADKATSKDDKAKIYGNMAAAAATGGDVVNALNYFDQKHEADPSTAKQDAYLEGSYYERMEQYDKAIEKYKIAIEYLKEQGNSSLSNSGDIKSLEERIQYLEDL